MTSPLPPGVRFWVATDRKHFRPRFAIEVDGVKVRLSRVHGEVMMHLLTNPNRRLSTPELAEAVYASQEDGGPQTADNATRVAVFNIRARLRRFGVVMEMERGMAGYKIASLYLDPNHKSPPEKPAPNRTSRAARRRMNPVKDPGCMAHGETPVSDSSWTLPRQGIVPTRPRHSSPHDAPWHVPNRLEQTGAVIVGGAYGKPPPKVPRRQPRTLTKEAAEYREPVRTGKWTMPERIEAKGGWKP